MTTDFFKKSFPIILSATVTSFMGRAFYKFTIAKSYLDLTSSIWTDVSIIMKYNMIMSCHKYLTNQRTHYISLMFTKAVNAFV